MAKSAARKSTPIKSAAAPSKISKETFEPGDMVTVTNGATGNVATLCRVAAEAKGWYVCHPIKADGSESGEKISARAGSMSLAPKAADEEGIDYFQSNRGAPLPYEPDAPTATKAVEFDEEGNPIPLEEGGDEELPEEEETIGSKMAAALAKARRHYAKCRRPNGTATAHNGDDIAKALRDYEPNEVADLADKCLELPAGTHFAKYGHLNPGQIRMNSGNKIRGAFTKALRDKDQSIVDRILTVLQLNEESDSETPEEGDAE